MNEEVSASLNRSFGATTVNSLNKIQTQDELIK
jgi:hypothetical protein